MEVIKRKNEKGITLIALIITIIILVILAAVSINAAYNSGIINYAVNGTQEYVQGAHDEQSRIANAEGLMDSVMERLENLQGGVQGGESPGGVASLPSVAAGARASTNSKYTSGTGENAKTAVIPEGFTVSGIAEEQSIAGGLVIYDIPQADLNNGMWDDDEDENDILDVQENYNQFVWVPVETPYVTEARIGEIIDNEDLSSFTSGTDRQKAINYLISEEGKYPMAVQLADGENYRGVLYDFSSSNAQRSAVSIACLEDFSLATSLDDYENQSYNREPAYLTDYEEADGGYLNSIGLTQSTLQEEYNSMVESVTANGGFWVARYELTTNSTAKISRGKTVASAYDYSLYTWYGLYYECRQLYNGIANSVQSIMISGSQYDQMMIWMSDLTNFVSGESTNPLFILNSTGMGWFDGPWVNGGECAPSGCADFLPAKQIFDLAGNMYEWTSEGNWNECRVRRAGSYRDMSDDAGLVYCPTHRDWRDPYCCDPEYGSRPSIYVKSAKSNVLTALTSPPSYE